MGEVYRARDTKLERDVAIKTLPHEVADDPDRLARFEREARVLASMNHPHIGAIYGFEDATTSDGLRVRGLVLELVEGDTLADRVMRGPIPVSEALAMARQIAAALDAAHQRGIVHRDLKPANVKITPAGVVKVLDFGLAKTSADDLRDRGADACDDRGDTRGCRARYDAVHEPGTGAWPAARQAHGHLGFRMCAVRNAQRTQGVCRRHDFRHHRHDPPARTGLERHPSADASRCASPDEAMSRKRSRAAAAGSRRRGPGDRRSRNGRRRDSFSTVDVVDGDGSGRSRGGGRRGDDAHAAAHRSCGASRGRAIPDSGRGQARRLRHASPCHRMDVILCSVGADAKGIFHLWIRSLDSLETTPLQGSETERENINFLPPVVWSPDSRVIAFFVGKIKRMDRTGRPATNSLRCARGRRRRGAGIPRMSFSSETRLAASCGALPEAVPRRR